jgi:hypothetical protein
MLISLLNPDEVKYKEHRKIDAEDIDYSSYVYETTLHDKDIEIVLGKEKHTYSKYDIVHFSVYLVMNDAPVSRIGIFEINSNKFINSIDEDGSIDLDKGEILFFIDTKELFKYNDSEERTNIPEGQSKGDDRKDYKMTENDYEDLTIEDVTRVKTDEVINEKVMETTKNDIFETIEDADILPVLDEENEHESDLLKTQYKESVKTGWIEKLTKNNQFGIVDNEGGGDCMFAGIRDAYRYAGKTTTVDKLRQVLSNSATEEIYDNYRKLYVDFLSESQSIDKELNDMKITLKSLKKMISKTTNKSENEKLLTSMKEQLAQFENKKQSLNIANQMLAEFNFMKQVDSFDSFRTFLKASSFWGDTWAITTMEKELNVKVIVLSEESFHQGDVDSVMQCGQINDTDVDNMKSFKPDYYIILSYTGNHYKLITYKNKGIFKFREIPFDIKSLVINKCLERNSGPYYLIPDFRQYKEKIGLDRNTGLREEPELNHELFDKDVTFMYHSNSNNKPYPGTGSGESIPESKKMEYSKLNKLKNWRRILDDEWSSPFTIDGMRWNSVKHYYLGSQYKKGFPDFSREFSLDSESELSKDIDMAKSVADTGKYKKRVLRKEDITIDPDFFQVGLNPRNKTERETALEAKYTQNLDMKQTLMETQRAKLVQFKRGKESVVDEQLMRLRRSLQ